MIERSKSDELMLYRGPSRCSFWCGMVMSKEYEQ